MRKNIFILLLTFTTLSLSSCWDDEDYSDEYYAVYPGIELYSGAAYANDISLDPLSIAMRLGLLLNEIDLVNAETPNSIEIGGALAAEPDWDLLGTYSADADFDDDDDYEDEEDLSRKELLLGETDHVSIWRSGDIYYIKYGHTTNSRHTQALLDNLYRKGTYIIDTKGVKLEKATSDNPWTVNAVGGTISISTGYDDSAEYRCDFNEDMEVYYDVIDPTSSDQKRGFHYRVGSISPNLYSSSSDPTNWVMSGYVNIEDFYEDSESFTMDDTFSKRFGLHIDAYGVPIGVPSLAFETIIPLDYRPLTAGYNKYNSYIKITLDEATDYYVDRFVYIEFRNDGGINIEYNGTIYED